MKRLLTLARLLILLLAAFFAVFSPEATLGDTLINLIPAFLLSTILLVSWKSPRIAAILLFITTITFTFFFATYEYYLKFMVITLPLLVAFLLFLFYLIFNPEIKDVDKEEDDPDEED